MSDLITQRKITLALQEVGAVVRQSARYDVTPDGLTDQLVHQLTAYVLSDHLVGDTYTFTTTAPSSWWQHFKRDHLPTVSKWRPVKHTTTTHKVTLDRYATYPEAQVNLPELGRPRYVEVTTYE